MSDHLQWLRNFSYQSMLSSIEVASFSSNRTAIQAHVETFQIDFPKDFHKFLSAKLL